MARPAWSDLKTSDIIAGQQIFASDWNTRITALNTFLDAIQADYLSQTETTAQAIASNIQFASGKTLTMGAGAGINEFSTDGTLAGDSDTAVPTEKAVKAYVDGDITPNSITAVGRIKTAGFLNMGTKSELTIATGSITPTGSNHSVDTEGDAATDNLDVIDPTNVANWDLLMLDPADGARTIVIRDKTEPGVEAGANINLVEGSGTFTMENNIDRILLMWNGSAWMELFRCNLGT